MSVGGSYVDELGGRRVFAHEIGTLPGFDRIVDRVKGIERYDRALSISRKDDVVLLKERPERSYLDWLRGLRMGTRKVLVLGGKKGRLIPDEIMKPGARARLYRMLGGRRKGTLFAPYFAGSREEAASRSLGLPLYANHTLVERFNSKIFFKEACRKLGIPVVDDMIYQADEGTAAFRELVKRMLDRTGSVMLRGEYGASASTTYVMKGADAAVIEDIRKASSGGDRYLIEPLFEAVSSPSSNWFIRKDRTPVHIRTSNQILDDGICHSGNEYPLRFREEVVKRLSLRLVRYLADQGFVGPLGFDYIETESGLFVTEMNPRVTGAIYPWEILYVLEKRHGRVAAAKSQNLPVPDGVDFASIGAAWDDILYDGKHAESVLFPFNVGPARDGKVTVLGTGLSQESVSGLLTEAEKRLSRAA